MCHSSPMLVRDKVVIAAKLFATLGSSAPAKLEAMIDEHMDAGDKEGAAFWREIAAAVRIVASQDPRSIAATVFTNAADKSTEAC
jgi:hypothetical protein